MKLQHEETGRMLDWPKGRPIPRGYSVIPAWYHAGIGLHVLDALSKRHGKGWEDGVCHKGGIVSGTWVVMGNRTGMMLRDILDLYESETEFLND